MITGKRCEEAKKTIKDNLPRITNFFIDKEFRYLVIGPKGETTKALEMAHNVNISFGEDGKVSIMGKESEKAKKAIESLIQRSKIANLFKEKFSVSRLTPRLICWKNGSTVERIESAYRGLVFITPVNKDETHILVMGSVAENFIFKMCLNRRNSLKEEEARG